MPAEIKLTKEKKIAILEKRIQSISGRKIAKELGLSHTTVYEFLASLPGPSSTDRIGSFPKDKNVMMSIFRLYVNEGMSPQEIADELHINVGYVVNTFLLAKQFKRVTYSDNYPRLAEWMNVNGYTIRRLADELGVDYGALAQTLAGKNGHMRLKLAEKIKKLTGLSITDLYVAGISHSQMPQTIHTDVIANAQI